MLWKPFFSMRYISAAAVSSALLLLPIPLSCTYSSILVSRFVFSVTHMAFVFIFYILVYCCI